MAALPSAGDLTTLSGLLTPGIIILWIRGRFRDPAPPKLAEKALSYTIVSVAYNAAASPLFHVPGGVTLPNWIWAGLFNLIVPAFIGVGIAYVDRSERFYALATKIGLRPAHHTPTAWDFAFRERPASYVLVHLTDGSSIAGAWIADSFASSTPGDRDLFLAELWRTEDDQTWTYMDPPRSMLICGGSIRLIEFINGGSNG